MRLLFVFVFLLGLVSCGEDEEKDKKRYQYINKKGSDIVFDTYTGDRYYNLYSTSSDSYLEKHSLDGSVKKIKKTGDIDKPKPKPKPEPEPEPKWEKVEYD